MVRYRKLEEVARYPLVAEDGSGIFYGCANVEVFALRVVSRNEIEATIVLIVNAGRIHEAPGTGWLKRLGQLANLKAAELCRHGYQIILLQEGHHFSQTTLVRLQKRFLIFRDVLAARRIGIGQRRIRQPRLERTVPRQLRLA